MPNREHDTTSTKTQRGGAFTWFVTRIIRSYQLIISPLIGPRCRFQPTCSDYTLIAINKYGLRKGAWLGAKRLVRCHPLNAGGWDPVPGDVAERATNEVVQTQPKPSALPETNNSC